MFPPLVAFCDSKAFENGFALRPTATTSTTTPFYSMYDVVAGESITGSAETEQDKWAARLI